MFKLNFALIISLALCVGAAGASDFDSGKSAWIKRDFGTALSKLSSAANQGDPEAECLIGYMYLNGQGVEQDATEAARWYRLAAKRGLAEAQNRLGMAYANGQGIVQEYAEAVRLYKLAASQGYTPSQYNLALSYGEGKGVPQDYIRAHMWLNLAAVKNSSIANDRDNYAAKMTPQQIAEAQKLARECQARNFKNCD